MSNFPKFSVSLFQIQEQATFSIKCSHFWLAFSTWMLASHLFQHVQCSIPWFFLFVASAVTPDHLVIEFLHFSLAYLPNPGFREHYFCIFPLIFFTIACTQLNLGCFFKNMHLKIHGMCVSQAWDEIQVYPEIWCYTFASRQHMLMEFGTQIKKLNRKENSALRLNGSIGPFHIPAVTPPFLWSPPYRVMLLSSICFILHIIGFCLVLSYHANALDRPGLIILRCTPN